MITKEEIIVNCTGGVEDSDVVNAIMFAANNVLDDEPMTKGDVLDMMNDLFYTIRRYCEDYVGR